MHLDTNVHNKYNRQSIAERKYINRQILNIMYCEHISAYKNCVDFETGQTFNIPFEFLQRVPIPLLDDKVNLLL